MKYLIYWLKSRRSGLKKLPGDTRDFDLGIFGWFEYKRKHEKYEIKTISVKNQYPINNCVFQATTTQKENDEKVELSARSLTGLAKRAGLISGNGFSNLRTGQLMLQKHGILEQKDLPEGNMDWSVYSRGWVDTEKISIHKTKSFWKVNSKNEIYKLLDDDRIVTMGMNWYTGFNQSGGFRAPWKVNGRVGLYVGGHALAIKGYDGDYLIIQNSYGADWGDGGDFYLHVDYAIGFIKKWGAYTNLDIPKNTAKFLSKYNNKSVKGNRSNEIYKIKGGKKRKYVNMEAFAKNADPVSYATVDQGELDLIPEGLNIK